MIVFALIISDPKIMERLRGVFMIYRVSKLTTAKGDKEFKGKDF